MAKKKEEDLINEPEEIGEEAEGDFAEEAPEVVASEAVRMTSDVPVQVVAVLGKKTISVKELVELTAGQVIDLSRPVNEVVDLVANGKLVAKGELVEIDGKLGVKVVKII